MPRISIVEYCGPYTDGTCGYCKDVGHKQTLGQPAQQLDGDKREEEGEENADNKGNSASFGAWAHSLTCADYQKLLDRGWRRSGKYLYKPTMEKTCCPQYTIRLDVTKFRLSGTQRKVLRNMNEYLKHDRKPKGIKEKVTKMELGKGDEKSPTTLSSEEQKKPNPKDEPKTGDDMPVKKKKLMRRERAIARWQSKGLDVAEMQRKRVEREAARVRTVKSYVDEAKEEWKHKLEVRLVQPTRDPERADETYRLYEKYQQIIHNDVKNTKSSYERFLTHSPLVDDSNDGITPHFGSYHQQYILDGKLVAVGVVDILPRCYSSKYLFYDPDYAFLSLGTYSALREIDFVRNSLMVSRPQLCYYYMGYYIDSCPKMRYKGTFRPSDLLCEYSAEWLPLSECLPKLHANSGKFTIWCPDLSPASPLPTDRTPVYRAQERDVLEWQLLKRMHPEVDAEEIREKLSTWDKAVGVHGTNIALYIPELRYTVGDSESSGESEEE